MKFVVERLVSHSIVVEAENRDALEKWIDENHDQVAVEMALEPGQEEELSLRTWIAGPEEEAVLVLSEAGLVALGGDVDEES